MINASTLFTDIPLFTGLSDEQLEYLESLAHQFTYPKNSLIITQGEHSQSLYIVLEGRLKVVASDADGRQTLLAFLNKGDFFGELSLLDGQPRSATVMPTEASKVLCLTHEGFESFVQRFPDTLLPMLRALATRLRILDDTICSLSTLDVYGRVARILLQEADDDPNEGLVVPRMTHQDIAEMVGSSREMVSRILKDLRDGGYIRINHSKKMVIEKKLPSRW